MTTHVLEPVAAIFTKAGKGCPLTPADRATLAARRADGPPYALPDEAAALGYVVCEHPGHLDALEDLAADLAAQSRLPVATIWKALAGFASNPGRVATGKAE